ncbi:DUF3990 domain-containing protein [Butyrivibrio sp. INlla21]|uniref:DUF3990 domain-containing protein n=1 Tax=Butyrivibrio sp. INlla21 TaxID=1520811 RepID=UPI0008F26C45|nr:DUF3990 domain-containing protein [Butyrivibrio sp. INlla21]SFU96425.1 Helix-turn-helix [Butyrivibrio sp. INlla21]
MDYNFYYDIKSIREILGVSQDELADEIGVQQITLSRSEQGKTTPSDKLLEKVYSYAFDNNIRLGRLKEMLWLESIKPGHKLLFHGAKGEIAGEIRVDMSRTNNDFGQGFYTGESYDQAISFVSGFEKSSVYFLDFNDSGLKAKKYRVNREWMLTIAYYRGALDEYEDHPMIRKIVAESRDCDYIIAPIADNRMFQIINSFIAGEITDEQCKHCLAATNLGNQYVFTSKRAVKKLQLVERCYIPMNERDYYMDIRTEETRLGDDKVKLARRQYRGKGRYIDEILK